MKDDMQTKCPENIRPTIVKFLENLDESNSEDQDAINDLESKILEMKEKIERIKKRIAANNDAIVYIVSRVPGLSYFISVDCS